jgi:hypothetical protein
MFIPVLLGSDSEDVYDYTRRRWDEMRQNFQNGKQPGVTNDAVGAHSAAALIFVEIKKNPSLVTDTLPPDSTYIESIINNPSNPLTWISQKVGQTVSSIEHAAALNMDKPAQLLQSMENAVSNAAPWFTKPSNLAIIAVGALALYSISKGRK